MTYNLAWIFDVRTTGDYGPWHPYDEAHFPLEDHPDAHFADSGDYLGQHELPDFYDNPAEKLVLALDEALGPIARHVGADFTGIRIRLWKDGDVDQQPDMLLEAIPRQLAQAHIRAATYPVQQAQTALQEALDALRSVIVEADLQNPLARTAEEAVRVIGEDVAEALPGDELAPFLTGGRLAIRIQRALAARGLTTHSLDTDLDNYEEQFGGLHVYWGGCVRLAVTLDGTVSASLLPEPDRWGMCLPLDDPDAERRREEKEQARLDAIASEHAKIFADVLRMWQTTAQAEDGHPADVDQLASGRSFTLHRATPQGRTAVA